MYNVLIHIIVINVMITYLNMAIKALVVWRLSCLAALSTSCESRATCKYAATLRARTARCVPPALKDVLGLCVCVCVSV